MFVRVLALQMWILGLDLLHTQCRQTLLSCTAHVLTLFCPCVCMQVRIGGGVYPDIVEADYLAGGTDYRVDAAGTKTMHNSLMYRLCYHE